MINYIDMKIKNHDQIMLEQVYETVSKEGNPNVSSDSRATVPSEAFNSSYCIFISGKPADIDAFKSAIANKGYEQHGVKLLKGNFKRDDGQPTPAVIVIPFEKDFHKIEKELFQIPNAQHGFWGQIGIGYKGKNWSVA